MAQGGEGFQALRQLSRLEYQQGTDISTARLCPHNHPVELEGTEHHQIACRQVNYLAIYHDPDRTLMDKQQLHALMGMVNLRELPGPVYPEGALHRMLVQV
ncbi:hypothetical protein D3C81_1924690 [compost metagenome]